MSYRTLIPAVATFALVGPMVGGLVMFICSVVDTYYVDDPVHARALLDEGLFGELVLWAYFFGILPLAMTGAVWGYITRRRLVAGSLTLLFRVWTGAAIGTLTVLVVALLLFWGLRDWSLLFYMEISGLCAGAVMSLVAQPSKN